MGGGHDVEVVVQRMRLQAGPRRVGARPDHQLGLLLGQPLPHFGEVHVEAGGNCDAPAVGVEYRYGGADRHRRRHVELRPVGKHLVVAAGDLPPAVDQDRGVQPPRSMDPIDSSFDPIDRAHDVGRVAARQLAHQGDGGAGQLFRIVVGLPHPGLRQGDEIAAARTLGVHRLGDPLQAGADRETERRDAYRTSRVARHHTCSKRNCSRASAKGPLRSCSCTSARKLTRCSAPYSR